MLERKRGSRTSLTCLAVIFLTTLMTLTVTQALAGFPRSPALQGCYDREAVTFNPVWASWVNAAKQKHWQEALTYAQQIVQSIRVCVARDHNSPPALDDLHSTLIDYSRNLYEAGKRSEALAADRETERIIEYLLTLPGSRDLETHQALIWDLRGVKGDMQCGCDRLDGNWYP